jgi:gamma-glutamyltranspeptidase/glutathione hydrolase
LRAVEPGALGIAVAKHPLAAQIGGGVLDQGGNAFDAAVAMGFALAVVEPYMSGLGGGKFQLVYRDARGRHGAIDGPVVTPIAVQPGCYEIDPKAPRGLFGFPGVKRRANEIGHQSVAVPGVVAGLCLTLERYGTLHLAEVVEPAVGLAERGFALSWIDVAYIAASYDKLIRFPGTAAVFLPDGQVPSPVFQHPLQPPSVLVQADLARSLRLIAAAGPEAFYRGELAKAMVQEIRSGGGWLSLEDLATYRAREVPILTGRYREWDLVTGPDVEVLEALAILQHFDVRAYGHNSVEALHHMAGACLLAHADFYDYIASPLESASDPEFYRGPDHIKRRSQQIVPNGPIRTRLFPDEEARDRFGPDSSMTTGYAVADRLGNVVSVLQTHGWTFGSGVTVPGTGILLNDQMLGFNPAPGTLTSVGPRRARPIPGWPIIGLGPDGSYFALASPGGNRVLCALTQVISNVIDFDMPIDQALAAPRIDCGSTPVSRKVILCNGELDAGVIRALRAMGHSVDVVPCSYTAPGSSPLSFAAPGGLHYDGSRGQFVGGNDPPVDHSVHYACR